MKYTCEEKKDEVTSNKRKKQKENNEVREVNRGRGGRGTGKSKRNGARNKG